MATANDATLRNALSLIASTSNGQIVFAEITNTELSDQLNVKIAHSPNPIFDFHISTPDMTPFRAIAYTIIINGPARPATRAAALAKATAVGGEPFLRYNPFLLVFDYTQGRLMAVAAATLFNAFAEEAASRPIPTSDSSAFSLTPSFDKQTISMYTTLQGSDIWYSSIDPSELTAASLIKGLDRIRSQTSSLQQEYPKIVSAIRKRLESPPLLTQPSGVSLSPNTAATESALAVIPLDDHQIDASAGDFVKVSPRIWRMIITAIKSSRAVLLVGPPGTGKTALLRMAIAELAASPEFSGVTGPRLDPLWATPDESWTARELVGGETISDTNVVFADGWVLRAISENRWLVLDEANRADMDRIFGGLLTWLSGGTVSLGPESTQPNARMIDLGWKRGSSMRVEVAPGAGLHAVSRIRYLAGDDWRLLGTYNALDAQRVFRFGAALGRRFARVPIPAIEPGLFVSVLREQTEHISLDVQQAIQNLYSAHYSSEATRLGPALFLAMCRYINAFNLANEDGQNLDLPESGLHERVVTVSTEPLVDPTPNSGTAITEAYLIHVGTWLAHLESEDLRDLQQRIISSGAINQEEWSWLSDLISALA